MRWTIVISDFPPDYTFYFSFIRYIDIVQSAAAVDASDNLIYNIMYKLSITTMPRGGFSHCFFFLFIFIVMRLATIDIN